MQIWRSVTAAALLHCSATLFQLSIDFLVLNQLFSRKSSLGFVIILSCKSCHFFLLGVDGIYSFKIFLTNCQHFLSHVYILILVGFIFIGLRLEFGNTSAISLKVILLVKQAFCSIWLCDFISPQVVRKKVFKGDYHIRPIILTSWVDCVWSDFAVLPFPKYFLRRSSNAIITYLICLPDVLFLILLDICYIDLPIDLF